MTAEPVDGSLPFGSRLIGKFDITGILGRGGFGITYEGFDVSLRRRVAIKELFPDGARRNGSEVIGSATIGMEYLRSRFVEEAQALARFDFPAIVRVLETFEDNGTAYMVMEYLEGENLEQRIHRLGRLSTHEMLQITEQLCGALERVHAVGILHRDVKPSNIILHPTRGAVLIDFGSAREVQHDVVKALTQMVSHGYAAPEQYSAAGKLSPATDIYALGATCWHALTGAKPASTMDRVAGTRLPEFNSQISGVPPNFSGFIDAALSLEMSSRPNSILAVRRMLGTVGSESSQPPHRSSNLDDGATRIWSSAADSAGASAGTTTILPKLPLLPDAPEKRRDSRRRTAYVVAAFMGVAAIAGIALSSRHTTPSAANSKTQTQVAAATGQTEVVTSAVPITTNVPAGAKETALETEADLQVQSAPTVPATFPPGPATLEATLLLLPSDRSTSSKAHLNAIQLAIRESKSDPAAARVALKVESGTDSQITERSVLAVFSSGGSAVALQRETLVASAKKPFIVIDGTSDTIGPSALRTIATDSQQAQQAANLAQSLGAARALILSDSSSEAASRTAGYRTIFETASEVQLDATTLDAAIAQWTPETALLIASNSMTEVATVLRRSKVPTASRIVVGVDGMFALPVGSYLTGAHIVTSLAPQAEDQAFSKKLRAAGLGSSDGETALFAYQSAKLVIDKILNGARTGEELSVAFAATNTPVRTRSYTYTKGAWK